MPLVLTSNYLLLDTSSGLSLYGSQYMTQILGVLPARIAIPDIVRKDELHFVWSAPDQDGLQTKEPIDLQPLLAQGALIEVELTNVEYDHFVRFSAVNLGNGECAVAAIAQERGWAICLDDLPAQRRIAQVTPQVEMISTSQIVKHWADTTAATTEEIRRILHNMRICGPYNPSPRDVLYNWCQLYW